MIRKALMVGMMLVLAGCAAKTPVPAPATGTVPLPVPPPSRPAPPAYNGLSPDVIKTRLGMPTFSRKDGTTEMWRYDSKQCHVFFFFTAGKISHVETIPRPTGQDIDTACLNALRKTS
jgi:hypothetical protein